MEVNGGFMKTIVGEKVMLRPIRSDDTDLIVKWRNNPNVLKNFIFREHLTREMHYDWMINRVAKGEVKQFIIIEKYTNQPVGTVYFRDINEKFHSAEFGIFIGEDDARGKGYGSETAQLFVKYGFEDLGLHRISLRLFEDNERAYQSYQKAGFKMEGTFRDMVYLEGKYHNIIFMSIISE